MNSAVKRWYCSYRYTLFTHAFVYLFSYVFIYLLFIYYVFVIYLCIYLFVIHLLFICYLFIIYVLFNQEMPHWDYKSLLQQCPGQDIKQWQTIFKKRKIILFFFIHHLLHPKVQHATRGGRSTKMLYFSISGINTVCTYVYINACINTEVWMWDNTPDGSPNAYIFIY